MRPLIAATLVALLAAPATRAEGPYLAGPTVPLTDVLPQRLMDNLEMPAAPVRVAARPTLNWRPGLVEASKELTQAEQAEAPAAPRAATPQPAALKPVALKPLAEPPRLVAPNAKPLVAKPQVQDQDPAPPKAADPQPSVTPEPTHEAAKPSPKAVEPAPTKPAPAAKSTPPTKTTPKAKPTAPAAEPKADVPPPPLSRSLRNVRSRLRSVLSFYYRKPLNTVENDPWELMHAMLAYELHSRVLDGGPRGDYMTAIGHLCFNRPSKRQQMMVLTDDGKIDVQVGVGLQGHRGQLLAMLAQCNVSPEYPIRVEGKAFTIQDLIEAEQRTCYAKTELTFKLIGLGHYLDSDARWVNDQGEAWDIPRLIKEEREQPIRGAACGGTHRLAGLSLAFRRREARDEPVDGEYAEAARFVSQYQGYAFQLQNDDGSMSTDWFRGRGDEEDIDRRLRTTGHLLEWLVYSLPEDQLRSHRTVRAIAYLTELLASNADHEWHLGSIAHALHALVLYDKRVFRPHDADASAQIAGAVDPTSGLFRGYPIYRGVMRNSPPESSGFFGLFGGARTGSAANRRR